MFKICVNNPLANAPTLLPTISELIQLKTQKTLLLSTPFILLIEAPTYKASNNFPALSYYQNPHPLPFIWHFSVQTNFVLKKLTN